jgi:hypothetical protein
VFLRVLGLECDGLVMDLRGAGVGCRFIPVRLRAFRIAGGLSLALRLVLMLQRARLALPSSLLSSPGFRDLL